MKKKFITYIMLFAVMFTVGINGVMAYNAHTISDEMVALCEYKGKSHSSSETLVYIYHDGDRIDYGYWTPDKTPIFKLHNFSERYLVENGLTSVENLPLEQSQLCPEVVYVDLFLTTEICIGDFSECSSVNNNIQETEKFVLTSSPYIEFVNATNDVIMSDINNLINDHRGYNKNSCLELYETAPYVAYENKELSGFYDQQIAKDIRLGDMDLSKEFDSVLDAIILDLDASMTFHDTNCREYSVENNDTEVLAKSESFRESQKEVLKELNVNLDTSLEGCELFNPLFLELIPIIELIQIGLIAGLIVLTILDFIKALVSEKDDEFKKAFNKIIKRVIIIAILFILPILIDALIGVFIPDLDTCLSSL